MRRLMESTSGEGPRDKRDHTILMLLCNFWIAKWRSPGIASRRPRLDERGDQGRAAEAASDTILSLVGLLGKVLFLLIPVAWFD